MNIAEIQAVALDLLRQSSKMAREMKVDKALLAELNARFGSVTRQHRMEFGNSERPSRIDFRVGGTNPVLLELAVRPADGTCQLYGSQNKPELFKLTRFPRSQAKLRSLLLMDFKAEPISLERLRQTYDPITAGRGNFERNAVRVVYIHENSQYNFIWQPRA
jgi:hypothetical protein